MSAVVGFLKTNLKIRKKKWGKGTVRKGCILDACNAAAKAEQVEEVRHGGGLVVDVGNMKDATRATKIHHRRRITKRL
jgi:hypothetical protein